jgi:hypothetical protein
MSVDNYNLIEGLLDFSDPDLFYHIQVIKRKKENRELGSNNVSVVHYYIDSLAKLQFLYPEMKEITKATKGRLCINLNRRSFEKLAYHNLKKVADQIMNRDFVNIKKSYSRVCGQYASEPLKKWILDIDKTDLTQTEVKNLEMFLHGVKSTIYTKIPTKNGSHWIVSPFNVQDMDKLHDIYQQVPIYESIHKNNPTILFIP